MFQSVGYLTINNTFVHAKCVLYMYNKHYYKDAEVEDLEKESELKISVDDYGCTSEAVYYSVPEDATTVFDCIPQVLPVKINDLGSYVFQCHRKINKEFKEQFSVSKS